ncbi:malonic semialdehyde reductase [Pusillimonas sp. ANT_WB101]|uniref:malonic semialdehyde reductase n=1 Tax=Pusillimonas sp. ANT_WB101 TaxID=2597356 RepID=UPI0011EE554E|nr:malonic semialdehyde reductase [Pusillimonas sp. ANT_WB101]KAA0893122.1 malonic semialdehyde reductase [Pusillimonas sp. ANT_WB101]
MLNVDVIQDQAQAERGSIDDTAINQLFDNARTYRDWWPTPVPSSTLKELYRLAALGPTSANCSPLRVMFVCSEDAKARLLPLVDKGNRASTSSAPVTAILAYDLRFYDQLIHLYPHQATAASWFNRSDTLIERTALQNSSLQGGYFVLAARALGLDCGPMGGFDAEAIAKEFFPDGSCRVNFLCNLGNGRDTSGYERLPRLDFMQACELV